MINLRGPAPGGMWISGSTTHRTAPDLRSHRGPRVGSDQRMSVRVVERRASRVVATAK
jgi:hypothetical protein